MRYSAPHILARPTLAPPAPPARPADFLAGLGDVMVGGGASNGIQQFRILCEQNIAGRLGPAALQNAQTAPDFGGCLRVCAALVQLGESESLPPDQQAAWERFKAATSPNDSADNVYWMFAKQIAASANRLAQAYYDQLGQGAWWEDDTASACNFTLLDTSSTGTTWYGGTTVQSRLSGDQWGTLFNKGWGILTKGIANGVLPITYLTAFLSGMLRPLVQRRFIAFHAPKGVDAQDPRAIAFRTAMKQLGWGSTTQYWFEATMQAWVEDDKAFQEQDRIYAAAITGLSYVSGGAILDKINQKLDEYWKVRSNAVQSINDFYDLYANPEMGGSSIPDADLEAMSAIREKFKEEDANAQNLLSSVGLWDASQPQLNGLDGAQMIVLGVAAIGALGILAYIVAIMTETSRSAAAQTKATANSVLATVSEIKDSCRRVYDDSEKTAEDEAAYQECLAKTDTLIASIPKPPEGSDPLGLKSVALVIGLGLAAFLAVKLIPRKSGGSPAS